MKWLNKKHTMTDIETLATTCDAVILSIGSCRFDFNGLGVTDKFYVNVDPHSCKEWGLRVDPETVKWWSTKPKHIIAQLSKPTPLPLEEALAQFAEWYKGDYHWCRGMFDVPILEYAFAKTGIKSPYKYWQAMDHRTAMTMLDVDFKASREGAEDYHNALGDAVAQAEALIKLFEKEAF